MKLARNIDNAGVDSLSIDPIRRSQLTVIDHCHSAVGEVAVLRDHTIGLA